jgi:hypothetical protein
VNAGEEEEEEEKEAAPELEFRKQKKKKTEEKKSREEGTRRAHTPDKEGETSGGGYLQERQLSQLQLVGTKILTLEGR